MLMKLTVLLFACLCLLLAVVASTHARKHQPAASNAAAPSPAPSCDETLWQHVYHPDRLEVKQKCITVTGVIAHRRPEPDGDYHIQVKLDPQFKHLINSVNKSKQGGNLVVEPICQHKVTQ